tara:strand:+ start:228 stop:1337 length:1110 start_codon:yes stop_codon:yes gene_type:complete
MKNMLIRELILNNCIKFGNYNLKNGEVSKYYFDIKNIISNPKLLVKIGDELYKNLNDFDIICGIPYGALPIATYISTTYNKPLIYLRDKKKEYGTEKLIEGTYNKNDRCVIIDDVITTGISLENEINILKDEVNIVDVAVILNRQQNPICSMDFKSLFYKNDIIRYMLQDITIKKKSKLIFSADLTDYNKIIDILNKIGIYIVACKIHYDIIENVDEFIPILISLSIKYNFLIIEDRKFNDISSIVNLQYKKFCNWADLVTVHSLVSKNVLDNLSGVLIVANMSNNDYDFSVKSIELSKSNKNNVIGFITQKRLISDNMICMTPGISFKKNSINDQKYRTINEVDTDYIIVGRALYNSNDIKNDIKLFL